MMIRMIGFDDTDWGITTAHKKPSSNCSRLLCFLLLFCCYQYFSEEVIAV